MRGLDYNCITVRTDTVCPGPGVCGGPLSVYDVRWGDPVCRGRIVIGEVTRLTPATPPHVLEYPLGMLP